MKESKIINILKVLEDISHIKDIDTLLEQVLYEARKIVNAEAGSIFLISNDYLSFEYVQNDILYGQHDKSNEHFYTKNRIKIDNKSIAGYVALSKQTVNLEDVYDINKSTPYSFNRNFDKLSKYRTKSLLSVPLVNNIGRVVGVFQIINATDKKNNVISFTEDDVFLVELFARQAADAIEKAVMTREIILRMIKIAELRDPQETGKHVNRVAAYSVEIYKKWAYKNSVPDKIIKYNKDILRIAAMLHDVGKVAIADSILRKKGKLSEKEYSEMKMHTVYGARLFEKSGSEWDDMAKDIILNHHEKWDGTGYPGKISDVHMENVKLKKGKKGEEIPLFARIVALADVFDALMSERRYKISWPKEKVFNLIKRESKKHFDPVIVESFFEIKERILAIWEKYN